MAKTGDKFDPKGWKGFIPITVKETIGIARQSEPVDTSFSIPGLGNIDCKRELRIVYENKGSLREVPSQFYGLKQENNNISGRVFFYATVPASASGTFRLYYGNKEALPVDYPSELSIKKGDGDPQHCFIENPFYRIETMPKSGQIWHVWNKKGTNTSWHHNEWENNINKGGDPCHWAPNCWVSYPERITNGYELKDGEECDFIDWHYVFGWDNPDTAIINGPLFIEIRRQGIVWPHPEHSRPDIKRDNKERIRAEVVYRFYDRLPLIYQASKIETLSDVTVNFIRNCQFVFLDHVFSHMIIAPDRRGLLPEDEEDIAVLRLMGIINKKPYDMIEHSLSNVLPSKLAYYGYYNDKTADGFALFQVSEKNTNLHTGKPVYQNHATLFTEVKDWSIYCCRALSYTNQRFNPENVTFLPKGECYEDENFCMVYRYNDLAPTLDMLKSENLKIKHPIQVDTAIKD
jgi:hypothetical protein